jgi:hypothetical protein
MYSDLIRAPQSVLFGFPLIRFIHTVRVALTVLYRVIRHKHQGVHCWSFCNTAHSRVVRESCFDGYKCVVYNYPMSAVYVFKSPH